MMLVVGGRGGRVGVGVLVFTFIISPTGHFFSRQSRTYKIQEKLFHCRRELTNIVPLTCTLVNHVIYSYVYWLHAFLIRENKCIVLCLVRPETRYKWRGRINILSCKSAIADLFSLLEFVNWEQNLPWSPMRSNYSSCTGPSPVVSH